MVPYAYNRLQVNKVSWRKIRKRKDDQWKPQVQNTAVSSVANEWPL